MAYDHNYLEDANPPWCTAPNTDNVTCYPETVIAGSGAAKSPVGMVGFHHYQGSLTQEQQALDTEHATYPNVPIWMTEATGNFPDTPPSPANNLVWEGQHDLMEPLQNWTSASLYWNLALDSSGNPHKGGCSTCRGMVTINPDGTFQGMRTTTTGPSSRSSFTPGRPTSARTRLPCRAPRTPARRRVQGHPPMGPT